MRYLIGILWANVFVIIWLQIFKIIEMWPSAFYLVILFVAAVLGTMWVVGSEVEKNEPSKKAPENRVKGIK